MQSLFIINPSGEGVLLLGGSLWRFSKPRLRLWIQLQAPSSRLDPERGGHKEDGKIVKTTAGARKVASCFSGFRIAEKQIL